MEEKKLTVSDQMVVSLAYQLKLEGGMEYERVEADTPMQYIHGGGQLLPGLEKELDGMGVGEQKTVVLEPAEGYGERTSEDMLEVARDDFPADYTLVSGKPIRIADENTGEEFTAYIKDVELDSVTLDFNHPLAGERLQFDVKVVDIRKASELELSHGHVHRAEEEDHLD